MKKVVRLTEKDVERMVKKILREDWRKGGWQDGQGKPGWLEDPNYSDREFERRKMNDEDLDQPYPTPEENRGWQDGDGEPPSQDEDYMGDNNSNNYMFWQNLQTIKEAVDGILGMDKNEVDKMLSNGHGWAIDHISTSTDDVEEVYHFLEGNETASSLADQQIDEDYMEDIDFEDLERKLSRHLDYSKKEVGKGVHYVDDPESFDYGKQLTGPKNLWWGYKHTSGTYQAKRYFSSLDIVEAEDSPFCEMVVGPFEANDRDDALRQVRELTN
jgi:hypothetical protein